MEKIKVLVRVRPFLQKENSSKTGLNVDSGNTQKIEISKSLKKFEATFDKVLSQESTQKEVFNFIKPCIDKIKGGLNCTILAYGQTGSGKTYTMFGGEWTKNDEVLENKQKKYLKKDKNNFLLNENLFIDPFSKTNGIIPNLIMTLFQIYGTDDSNITITCSYIQIYNEKVYDLLVEEDEIDVKKNDFDLLTGVGKQKEKPIKQKPLKIKYDKINGVIIEGVNEIRTPSFYDIFELLRQGEINRKIRQTKRNEMSSRSHTIFIINIQNEKLKVISKIKLCDLAGSERYDSRETYKKLHFDEMKNINKSLLVLGNVIHSLGTRKSNLNMISHKKDKQKKVFAPFKDSKLTQILEDSLGGNSLTYLIANISPCKENYDETLSTLKFADRAHSIITKVSMNKLDYKNESKEFYKIYNELSQLKQLLNIRRKRGTLEPIQEEFFNLKDENAELKKYLGGENNLERIKELMNENKNLRKELKNLTKQNQSLKIEMKGNPIINLKEGAYNISNVEKIDHFESKNKTNKNRYIINNNYKENATNNKISRNIEKSKEINNFTNKIYLNTMDEQITNHKDNNKQEYDNNEQDHKIIFNGLNKNNKNYNKKQDNKTEKNILRESGKNIIYGTDNKMDIKNNDKDSNLDNILYENSKNNYISNSENKKNNIISKISNEKKDSKKSKLNNLTSSIERLEELNRLESENKKETQELLENLGDNFNY